jgi:hypothetical protein
MKKLLLPALLILVSTGIASAQLSVRLYNYRPTGDYGAYFKPTFSAEVGYAKTFEDNWVRPVLMGTVINLRPRMKEFPTTGEIEDYNGVRVYPGTMTYYRFIMAQLHGGIDVAVYKKEDKFNAFLGTSLIAGQAFVHYHEVIPQVMDEEGYVGGTELGFQLRLGGEYQVNDYLGIIVSANRNFYLMISEDLGGTYWSNDYGVGVSYHF